MATIDQPAGGPPPAVSSRIEHPRLAHGALSLFDTLSSTLANLAPVEGIFLSLTLVVVAMGSQAPWALYGIYEFVQPSQPAPANVYWVWILAIVLIAAAGTAIVYLRRPEVIRLAGSLGPEFLPEDS